MTREELLKSKGYWIAQFQIKLFETIRQYLKDHNLTKSEFAEQMGVSKSYVTQILNGDFDHKMSKYVEIMVACQKAPIIKTMNIDDYAMDDLCQFEQLMYSSPKRVDIASRKGHYSKLPLKTNTKSSIEKYRSFTTFSTSDSNDKISQYPY